MKIFAIQEGQMYAESHIPNPISKDNALKAPTCMICSMEEGVQRNAFDDKEKMEENTHGEHHILPYARMQSAA